MLQKKLLILFVAMILASHILTVSAQAFNRNTAIISLNLGIANMWHFGSYYGPYSNGYASSYNPLTGQFSVDGEFAVHRYIGLGFHTGIGGRVRNSDYGNYGYRSEINLPIGFIANFHFYQLIADKAKRGNKIHADRLDIYAGLNIGSGISIFPSDPAYKYYNETNITALFYVGPQLGIRYYFNNRVAINGELGWGKTIIVAGVTFNLGPAKRTANNTKNIK